MEQTYTVNTLPEKPEGIFRIPECNLDEFAARMQKLNRRAAKLGATPVSSETIGSYMLETRQRVHGTLDEEMTGEPRYRTVLTRYHEVRVSGEAPHVAGWTFIATIQHEEAGNILRTVHGWEGTLPEEFRGSDPTRCDHCHTRRQRTDTYVLVSDTGAYMQVGRNCLADFLGGVAPERIAQWAETLADLEAYLTGGFDGARGIQYHKIETLLVNATVLGRLFGFRSRAQATAESTEEKPVTSTASYVNSLYFGSEKYARELGAKIDEARTDEDVAFAQAALAWAQGIEAPKSDYEWNIRTLANSGAVQARSFGFAVSIVTSYKKRLEGEAKRELARRAATVSEWFGTPKKREEFSLLVTGTRAYESMYGSGVLVFFADAAGNRAKWFASNAAEVDWPAGQTVRVKATVKAHETYRDAKETLLTRVARLDAPKPVDADE